MNTNWVQFIVSVFAGLAAAIPLVIKLVEYVQKAVKEKNWSKVLNIVIKNMEVAEIMFDNGAERKEWVLAMVEKSADTVNYDIDMSVINKLVDTLCNMSKRINTSNAGQEAGE